MKRPHRPVRTCAACRQEAGKSELVRLVRRPDGIVMADRSERAPGRGAYLHPTPECLEIARRKHVLERALSASVPSDLWADLTP